MTNYEFDELTRMFTKCGDLSMHHLSLAIAETDHAKTNRHFSLSKQYLYIRDRLLEIMMREMEL